MSSLNQLIEQKDDLTQKIRETHIYLNSLQKDYSSISKQIDQLCQHKWIYTDISVPYDQKPYICEVCGRYK